MRIGVMSDSHGNAELVRKALQQMGNVDMLLHAGDGYREAVRIPKLAGIETHAVIGNCDMMRGPLEQIIEIQGKKLFLTHGHRYHVKDGLFGLFYRAKEVGAGLVVFGHTHVPLCICHEGIYFINPGSLAHPRTGRERGYGIIDIMDGEDVKVEIVHLLDP